MSTPKTTPFAFLELVAKNESFLAMVDALDLRIAQGHSHDALLMLQETGAPDRVAWEIIDRWPTRLRRPFQVLRLQAACRLASFVLRVEEHDWTAILARCLRYERARNLENLSGSEGGGNPNSISG